METVGGKKNIDSEKVVKKKCSEKILKKKIVKYTYTYGGKNTGKKIQKRSGKDSRDSESNTGKKNMHSGKENRNSKK